MRRLNHGFGMIDVIVGVALMLILFLALFGVLRASLMLSAIAKAKAAAVEVASSQMEYLRGLSYDSLGTVGGIPSGAVPQIATTTVDGVVYSIRTFIEYVDDPADGVGTLDSNSITTDYKLGKVTVSYTLGGITRSVELLSNFVPISIESSTGGGTLSIHVVDAASADLGDATIHIVNTATSPVIDLTTFTNVGGYTIIGGAATSSQYQIYVSRDGYSSAQTYARTSQNVNPTPGYLTVSKNQVTSGTFFIDRLATLTLNSFSPAVTSAFSDTFANSSNLASLSNTQVSAGSLILASEALSGSARSTAISPSYLAGWGILSATLSTTTGTTALVRVADATGTLIPDLQLPGNSAGFLTFPVSLTNISTISYPSVTLLADLTSNSTSTTPRILDWSISHTDGPIPSPNISFTLTGAKTIGTDSNDAPIYKTVVNDTTGASSSKSKTLEWDLYTLSLGSSPLIESCAISPYVVAPASNTEVSLIVGTSTANTLPVEVEDTASTTIPNAKVVLKKSGYAATILTSSCGFAFFNGLSNGNYDATVSATGHATTTFPGIGVSGHTANMTLVLP